MNIERQKLKLSEHLGYVGACVSMYIMLMFVPNFITIYYTDIVGLSASTVGLVILFCKITDGITDILMGVIIDRTHSRWGKARPWILAGGIGSAVSLFLLFNEPADLGQTGAVLFCAATYFMVCPVFGTIISVAQAAIVPMISSDDRERSVMGLIQSFSLIVVTGFVAVVTPVLISAMGESRETYTAVSFVYMIVSIVSAIVAFVLLREHETESSMDVKENFSAKEILDAIAHNRHFIFLTLGCIFYNVSCVSGATTYYAKYILGDVGQVAFMTLCMAGSYVLLFVALKLKEWFTVRSMLVAGFLISALGCIVLWFAKDNVPLVGIGIMLKGVGVFPVMAYGAPLTGQVSDYTEHQTGKRMDGVIFSGFSMGGKVGTGLGTAIVGWVMGWFGYVGTAEVQTTSALVGIRFANSLVPFVFCILAALCFSFVTIEKENALITGRTRFSDIYRRPEFHTHEKALHMMHGITDKLLSLITIDQLSKIIKTWNAESMVDGLQYLSNCAKKRETFFEIYSEEERRNDPEKNDTILAAYPLEKQAKCVFILAGGGYESVCSILEAYPIAKKVNEMGYAAFVVKYRHAANASAPNPMDDLAAAIRFVMNHCNQFHVDMTGYAVMGFSAGGHLCASFGTEDLGYAHYSLPKPAALILSYPVITMGSLTHDGSRKALLGADASAELIDKYSVENHVAKQYPPVYLWQFDADDTVPIQNSKMMAAALEANGVSYVYQVYPGTAHGVGEGRGMVCEGWITEAIHFWEAQF